MRALPIRVRLTLWYFAMFATAACLLSAASWWMLRRSVNATEYHDLQERAEDVEVLLAHQDANAGIDDIRNEFAAIYTLKDDGKWLQVLDENGNWLFRSKRMQAENPALPLPSQLPAQGVTTEFQQGTRYVRILAYPIQVRGKRYYVQTGVALNKSMALLTSFGMDLLLLTPAMILLAAFAGHSMSKRALRPVADLAAEARRIHDRNLDSRLAVPPADDEIADLARTLNQMLERIDRAFESVKAFTGNASHEMRSPVALLRTEIEVALFRPREPEEYRETLRSMHDETVRMTSLIENLLSLARADGGAEAIAFTQIDLKLLFDSVRQAWSKSMEISMLEFQVKQPPAHLTALGDASGVLRLLSILLENAGKYTPPGGSVILQAEASGNSIQIFVRDTGVGIARENLPRIFDRFFRTAAPGGSPTSGSGLGLALARWIAECHGTKLTVESTPGTGSTFSFNLQRVPLDGIGGHENINWPSPREVFGKIDGRQFRMERLAE
jgi:heavy metal sensor kinase